MQHLVPIIWWKRRVDGLPKHLGHVGPLPMRHLVPIIRWKRRVDGLPKHLGHVGRCRLWELAHVGCCRLLSPVVMLTGMEVAVVD
jgi:hypothetical protein